MEDDHKKRLHHLTGRTREWGVTVNKHPSEKGDLGGKALGVGACA